ncbi:hypothetical protein [Ponticaulis sp.]|uniref:hypothetical protein n=1 Tax=Ponticaulis sp. TaxID=2020902 RepID=UPI0025DC8E9E|nr:hypothetical protein [Ponticaulis sp.]
MTGKITLLCIRVIRPLAAALIGLALVQAMASSPVDSSESSSTTVHIHIPAA